MIVATVAMAPSPDGFALIPATLGTAQETMAVNTGAEISELTQDTAARLHLKIIQNQFGMYNASGNFSEKAAAVSPFRHRQRLDQELRVSHRPVGAGGAAGTIAADVLRAYDVISISAAARSIWSRRPLCRQGDHLADQRGRRGGDDRDAGGRIVLPLTVDGHPLKAVLDTGSATSSITQGAANSIGAASTTQAPSSSSRRWRWMPFPSPTPSSTS